MIGLVWNGMMSFGGGWFFLAASEAISVGNKTYTLPGIGSYVAAAVDKGDIGEVGIAIGVMVILVVGVNFVFWRPLVAYAEKFRVETSEAAEQPKSYVLEPAAPVEHPRLHRQAAEAGRPRPRPGDPAVRAGRVPAAPSRVQAPGRRRRVRGRDRGGVIVWGVYRGVVYFDHTAGFGQFAHVSSVSASLLSCASSSSWRCPP